MTRETHVRGVGMFPFTTPSRSQSYNLMAQKAVTAALKDARLGLQHNIGLGGACVVTLYEAVN